MKAAMVLPYCWIHQHYRLVDWTPERAWWMAVLASVFCDFCTYW